MEFIPRPVPAASDASPADAHRRLVHEVGVAAVAAALGMAEDAPVQPSVHASRDARMLLPREAA